MSEQKVIKAWSYSRYQTYETCPFKAKLLYLDGFKEPSSEALEKGVRVHSEIERYLKLEKEPIPQSAIKLCTDYEELKTAKPYVELEVCFDKDWNSIEWFSKQAYCRIKIDALVKYEDHVFIIDHKTGKVRDNYEPQLELYSLAALLMFPKIQYVDTALFFVDAGRRYDGQRYTRDDLEMLKARWIDRVTPMLTDTEFTPTPNQWCQYCVFRKANGGPCQAA